MERAPGWVLAAALPPPPPALLSGTPWRRLGLLVTAGAAAMGLTALGVLPAAVPAVAAIALGHGGLLMTALGWSAAGRSGVCPPASLVPVVLLAVAATAGVLHPTGALGYLAVPVWLWREAHRGRLDRLGLAGRPPVMAMLAGAAVGAGLGAHLLTSATRTLGHRPHVEPAALLGWLAYDLGANVLAAECFFRGALFNRLQRRWSFGTAAPVAAAAFVARYLVDPLLPRAPEMMVGAVFYLAALGLANAWLLWRWGHLLPGLASGLAFFAAYRSIAR